MAAIWRRWCGRTGALLAIALLVGMLVGVGPANAQEEARKAPVSLDGKVLFQVSPSKDFTAYERANEATRALQRIARSDESVRVDVRPGGELPTIAINGNHLLTVTTADVPSGRPLEQQAERWAAQIDIAMEEAREERTMEARLRAALLTLLAAGVAFAVSIALGWFWERWVLPSVRDRAAREESATSQLTRRVLASRILLNTLRAVVWLGAIAYGTNRFPITRGLTWRVANSIYTSLTADLFELGEDAYSVLDLGILLAMLVGTVAIARALRRLLRLRVLGLTGLSRAAQETIALIANYLFVGVGAIVILQLWGLDISSLTVFAGVLGVGIGLGLQGVATEFVSGLVLIFEQPIRAGDFVEVDGMVGTVDRIGVRSTEISTIDRISVIVPNSRFLNQNVTNWSHNNPVSRLRLPVGVAYGSNLTVVRGALLDAAEAHAEVLPIPAPTVFFLGFGDSSLDLALLVWIAEPRLQFQIKSDLYFKIDELFRDRGVEIPFPQRDLHVRSGVEKLTNGALKQ